jgi:arabinogalactan endo-1,4-beta-galactosidase
MASRLISSTVFVIAVATGVLSHGALVMRFSISGPGTAPAMAVYQSFGSENPYGVSQGAHRDTVLMPRSFELAGQAGIGWVRFGIWYSIVNPSPGVFRYEGFDAQVAKARQEGLRILGKLAFAAPWNTSAPPDLPPGADPLHFPPRDYQAWADYVFQTVSRYRDQIQYWEVWNEPDLRGFWAGTSAQYAELLAVTYEAVKRADPTAKVLLGGLALGGPDQRLNPNFLTEILNDARYPAARYFDIMNFHHYGTRDEARRRMDYVRDALRQANASDKAIWITETGYSSDPSQQSDLNYQGLEGQANWLRDMIPYLLSDLGADKVFWYRLYDYPADFNQDVGARYHGLIDNQGNPKPAYDAYRNLIASSNQQPRLTSLTLFKKGRQIDHLVAGAKTKKYQITVSGSGFVDGTQLFVNGIQVEILSLSGAEITAKLPPGRVSSSGSWPVQARNPDGQLSNTLSIQIRDE